MNKKYIFPKMQYLKNDTKSLYIFFDNGDYLQIKCAEIINISINVYDKLIRSHHGFNPVVESGYLKLKICNKPAFTHTSHFLYNESDFLKNRKNYIENRCINEGGITEIWLFNENNWHKVLHCKAQAKKEDDFLIINFLQQPEMGSYKDSNNYINFGNFEKKDINNIDLDFENCESFVVYQDEIKEMNLIFDNKLIWVDDLYRKAIGGYIKIKLDKDYFRENSLFDKDKKLKIKDFEQRLCGKKGEDIHDICHLYIDYNHAGYGSSSTECIEIDDVKSDEEIKKLEKLEENDEGYYQYEGGFCKKLPDSSIIIAFGANAKETVKKLISKN